MIDNEERLNRRTQTCRHFSGFINEVCKAGVNYANVKDSDAKYPAQTHPCVPAWDDEASCKTTCDKFNAWTREEVLEREAASKQRLAESFENINKGICPNHKTPMTKRQVGKCVYADPCGCRLYQGKV